MKMMQGAFFLACSNMSRTRLAPTPTNISTKSEPEMVKNATRNPSAQTLELAGVAQEFDDFLKVLLGFIDTRNVLEGDSAMRFRQHLGARFAKAHRLAGAALHLSRQEDPHPDQGDERQPGDQQRHEPRHIVAGRFR